MAFDERILDEAADWAVRTGDPAFADWDAFTLWLEGDPAHALAYDLVMAGTAEAAEALPSVASAPLPDAANGPRGNRRWFAGLIGIAAATAAVFGAWTLRDQSYVIATQPGETRLVALDTGGEVLLAGDSRIVLDRGNPDLAVLEQGQALFTIVHDEKRTFRVEAGDSTFVDIGTVFDVKHSPRATSLAVSEGAVLFNPERQKVRVDPGHVLTVSPGSPDYRLAAIDPGQVGEWSEGRLTFQDALLMDVAADLSRATGTRFEAAAEAAGRRVSGSLLLAPLRDDPRTLAPLLGVAVRAEGGAWVIEAR